MDQLSCVSLNVRGLRNRVKRQCVFNYLNSKKVHIAFLQETYCTENFKDAFDKDWNGSIFHSFASSSLSKGVCILLSNDIEYEVMDVHSDDDGRSILLNIDIGGVKLSLVCIYSPNV